MSNLEQNSERMYDINNSDDFEKIVNQIRNGRMSFIGELYQELYRGQSKDEYVLKPSITRYVNSLRELKELETNIISDFKGLVEETSNPKKFIQLTNHNFNYENDWRWIEQMQHYRIPTRLLDWSLDPKIALFFAVESNFSDVGQFWVYKSPLNWSCNDHFELNPFNKEINIISNSSFYVEEDYKDKIAEQRRAFQSGKFTFQDFEKSIIPMETQESLQGKIEKYTIAPNSKNALLEYLASQNITKDSIYVNYNGEIENLVKVLKAKYNLK